MEIRLLKENEKIRAAEIAVISFHQRVEDLEKAKNDWGAGVPRHWGAFDDDGTLMAHMLDNQYMSWLDGTPVRNGGIGAVSTLPEYRTEGAVREIFRKLLPAAYVDGEVISTLYPFSHAFYRKFGYETVCWKNVYTFSPAVLRGYTFGGKVRQWKTGDPAEDWTALYNAFASSFNLAVFRDDARMAEHLKGEYYKDRKFSYMLWENGRPAAFLIFQDIRHDPKAILEVQNLAWNGPAGFRAILGFLSRFSADYGTIRLFLPRNIELLSLIRSPLAYDIEKTTDQAYMIRVINAAKALEVIRKPEGCSFVIRISDEIIPENNGTWKVTAGGVSPTEEEPDLCVSEKALGQLVCGAVSLAEAEYREDTAVRKNRETLERVFIRKPILVEDHF